MITQLWFGMVVVKRNKSPVRNGTTETETLPIAAATTADGSELVNCENLSNKNDRYSNSVSAA